MRKSSYPTLDGFLDLPFYEILRSTRTRLESLPLSEDNPEVKKVKSLVMQVTDAETPSIIQQLQYFSDWYRAKRVIAICLKLRQRLRYWAAGVQTQVHTTTQQSNVEDLHQGEVEIIKAVQNEAFPKEIELLKPLKSTHTDRESVKSCKACLKKTSSLYRLDPFIDNEELLRVGGRISRAYTPYHIKHPVILPRKGHITVLIIRYYHQRINHQERGMTLNEI